MVAAGDGIGVGLKIIAGAETARVRTFDFLSESSRADVGIKLQS